MDQNQNQNQNRREEKMKSGDVDWSEMCSDALELILESLSFPDIYRARTVCSSWYSVSKSCFVGSRNRSPWLILFPEKSSKLFHKSPAMESCKLLDPVKGKTWKSRNLGEKLSGSRCVASYGNWLLMLNQSLNFSVLNVFTGETINLPSLSLSFDGYVSLQRKDDGGIFLQHSWMDRETIINRYINTAILWIDEKTKDYVVCWIYDDQYLFSYKKGGKSWWHLEDTKCLAMAYKVQKLCVYTSGHFIKILDYSGDYPVEIEENPYLHHPFDYVTQQWEYIWKRRLAVTSLGDVLIILSLKSVFENKEERLFYIFKVNFQDGKWERVYSLGDQMLVFGNGFTLAVPSSAKQDVGGEIIKRNSIYFDADDIWPPQTRTEFPSSAGAFDLATSTISWSRYASFLSNSRWFVPGSDIK